MLSDVVSFSMSMAYIGLLVVFGVFMTGHLGTNSLEEVVNRNDCYLMPPLWFCKLSFNFVLGILSIGVLSLPCEKWTKMNSFLFFGLFFDVACVSSMAYFSLLAYGFARLATIALSVQLIMSIVMQIHMIRNKHSMNEISSVIWRGYVGFLHLLSVYCISVHLTQLGISENMPEVSGSRWAVLTLVFYAVYCGSVQGILLREGGAPFMFMVLCLSLVSKWGYSSALEVPGIVIGVVPFVLWVSSVVVVHYYSKLAVIPPYKSFTVEI